MSNDRIPEVDAVRGLAAAIVAFVFHQHFLLGNYRSGPLDGLPVFSWIHDYGWTMVDLFFVVSGYIFAHVYASREEFGVSFRQFWIARIARLYPLHLLTLALVIVVLAFGTPATGANILTDTRHLVLNLLMLQESGLNTGKSFNVPTWSISVEMFCYALFFGVAALNFRYLLVWSAMFVVIGFNLGMVDDPTIVHIARGMSGYFAGVIVYRFRAASIVVPALLMLIGVSLFSSINHIDTGIFLSLTCWSAVLMIAPKIGFLRHKFLTWLGDRSYSIYLIHAPVYWAINILLFGGDAVPPALVVPTLLGAIILILAASDLSFRFFENPARKAINAYTGISRPSAIAAA
jgi:peptidoglycan/LPS O-acetylase OafA/YrhL